MARVCPPILLAKCKCGKIKVKDYSDSDPYWTADCTIVKLTKQSKLAIVNCPEHGGDIYEMIGNFFCRDYHYHQGGIGLGQA